MKLSIPAFFLLALPAAAQTYYFNPYPEPMTATAQQPVGATLHWYAPDVFVTTVDGDERYVDTVDSYIVAHSTSEITELNFGTAETLPFPGSAQSYGNLEELPVIGLWAPGLHYFAFKAVFEDGISDILGSTSVSLTGDSVPPLSVSWGLPPVGDVTHFSATITWLPTTDGGPSPSGIRDYEVRASSTGPIDSPAAWTAAPAGRRLPLGIGGAHPTKVVYGGLEAGTTYWFAVCAIDLAGHSGAPNGTSPAATTLNAPPPAPESKSDRCGAGPSPAGSLLVLAAMALFLSRIR